MPFRKPHALAAILAGMTVALTIWLAGRTTSSPEVSSRMIAPRVSPPRVAITPGSVPALEAPVVLGRTRRDPSEPPGSRGVVRVSRRTARLERRGATSVELRTRSVTADAVERIEVAGEGIEQSWTWDEAPHARELIVEVALSAGELVGEDEEGLHFRAGGLSYRYGHGTFIDADGARIAVRAETIAGGVRLVVPESVVAEARFPAVLDPYFGPELPFGDLVPVVGPSQMSWDAAWDGSQHVFVFNDGRFFKGVMAARVAPDGTRIDPVGVPLSGDSDGGDSPRVARLGGGVAVAWTSQLDHTVYMRTLGSSGGPLEPAPIRISPQGVSAYGVDIACTATQCLVVWLNETSMSAYNVVAQRVGANGQVIDATPFVLSSVAGAYAVASNGVGYFVALSDARTGTSQIYTYRISTSGVLADPAGLQVTFGSTGSTAPLAASDGTNYGMSFSTGFATSFRAVPDVAGGPTGGSEAAGAYLYASRALTFDGVSYLFTAARAEDTHAGLAQRFAQTGEAIDVAPAVTIYADDLAHSAPIASGAPGQSTAFVWTRNGQLLFQRRSSDLVSTVDTNATPLAPAPNLQSAAVGAFSGETYLAVYSDSRGLYASRMARTGEPLDAAAIAIAPGYFGNDYSVAPVGAGFLVVYGTPDSSDVMGVIVSANGTPGAAFPVAAGAGTQHHAVLAPVADASRVLSLHANAPAIGSARTLEGRIVFADGSVTQGGVAVSGTTPVYPTVLLPTADAAKLVLFYQTDTSSFHVKRVSATGVSQETAITIAPAVQGTPIAVRTGAATYAVAWNDAADGLHVAILDYATGSAVITPTYASPGAYVLAMARVGDELVLGISTGAEATRKLRVLTLGATLPTGASDVPAATSPTTTAEQFSFVEGPANEALLFLDTTQHTLTDPGSRLRIRRVVSPKPVGSACDASAHCALGNCVDGMCCDSVCGGTTANDCLACSQAAGATADGTCTTLGASHTCRPSVGACDIAEQCAGDATCGADLAAAPGTECATQAGPCEAPDTCSGAVGATATCVPRIADATVVCRAPAGACDAPELCTGASTDCPNDGPVEDGTSCDDGSLCSTMSACHAGTCTGTVSVDCDDEDACTADACGIDGACMHTQIAACADAGVLDAGSDAASDAGGGGDAGESDTAGGGCAVRHADDPASTLTLAFLFATLVSRTMRKRARR